LSWSHNLYIVYVGFRELCALIVTEATYGDMSQNPAPPPSYTDATVYSTAPTEGK